jgi:hypothetical protein
MEKNMTVTRIRIMNPDRSVQVLDQTWSQLCETLSRLPEDDRCFFWDMRSVPLPEGGSLKLVKENV